MPVHAFDDAHRIIADAGLANVWVGQSQLRELIAGGLDLPLATAALREAASRCDDAECDGRAPDAKTVDVLIRYMDHFGAPEALPALIQLDGRGHYASGASDAILGREMAASMQPCRPPDASEVAAARRALADFVVIDRDGSTMTARAPTPKELEDLAYFYAGAGASADGIVDGAPPVAAPVAVAGDPADAVEIARRQQDLVRLGEALDAADLEGAREAAVTYLASLGYPGPIDGSREVDQTWGGARFSYVMRDLALVSEVVGELGTAADMYQRANPAGGMCGTSTDYRRGAQLHGFIRAKERLGECREVVALRLLDWDDQYDPGEESDASTEPDYGPGRLARDGWDVARMYRGALLTRNRDGDPQLVRAALTAAGDVGVGAAGLRRFEREGAEAWEWRVRATEGLADVGGRDAVDELVALLPSADEAHRIRLLDAIGAMARRRWSGPCDPDETRGWFGGGSNIWSRKVSAFGRSCPTQLGDAEARRLADRLLPYAKDETTPTGRAAIRAVGYLAVPQHRRRLERWRARGRKAQRAACDGIEEWTQACQDAREFHDAADEGYEAWAEAVQPAAPPKG
jgi:hypothetical protein